MDQDKSKRDDELQELAAQLRGGSVEALHEIFVRLGPVILGRLTQRFKGVLKSDEIEDVLGVALYDLWRQRERYDPERSPLLPWFYLLARHAAVNWLRGRGHPQLRLREEYRPAASPETLPAGLQKRLEELLDRQTEEDRDILLSFAASGGEGSWAAEVAGRWGVSPNVVSQRKKRLLDWLRQELLARLDPSSQIEVEEKRMMPQSSKWVERLEKHGSALKHLGACLAKAAEQAAAHGGDVRARFARQWNQALGDKAAGQERLETLKQSWAWMEGLLEAGAKYRRELQAFVERCRNDSRLSKSTLFDQPRDLVLERIEQGIVGVADAIERCMPPEVRRERRGEVQVEWQDHGQLDALCAWKEQSTGPKLPLRRTACASMRSHAELDFEEAETCADLLLRDLRAGKVALPDFQRADKKGQTTEVTLLLWHPETVEPVKAVPLTNEPLPLADDQFELELALWRDHPEAAAAVDEAICAAVAEDCRHSAETSSGQPPAGTEMPSQATVEEVLQWFRRRESERQGGTAQSATRQVIHELQKLSGRSEEEVLMLLAPLVEERGATAGSHVPCLDRQQALAFLWSQIIGR